MEMENIREACRDCALCALAAGRTRLVFGDGNPKAEVMLIGEGPGQTEDEEGLARLVQLIGEKVDFTGLRTL